MATTDDLTGELIKFNAFLAVEEERAQQERTLKKAVRLREDAAAALKKVVADTKASKEDKDAAEAAWKAAVETEERVQAGGPLVLPAEPTQAADTGSEAESSDATETGSEPESSDATETGSEPESSDATDAGSGAESSDAADTGSEPESSDATDTGSEAQPSASDDAPDTGPEPETAPETAAQAAPAGTEATGEEGAATDPEAPADL